jgi:uncharacterized RDD family membrane protein YckC
MTIETQPQTGQNYEVVSEVKRLINFVIDTTIIFTLLYLLTSFVPAPETDAMISFIIICVFFLYYLIFEYFLQKTPAKFITRTKVVSLDGSKPSMGTIALRTLCRLVPFDVISSIGTPKDERTWWHDRWVNTRVVKA